MSIILITLGLLLLVLAFLAFASMNPCARIFLKSVCRLKTTKAIALTFDDGPHPQYTPMLLDLLKRLDVKASFFLIGKHVEDYPQIVKRMVEEGHSVGLHSYAHNYSYGFKSSQGVLADLKQNKAAIKTATGVDVGLFRPPFGVTNPNIAKAVRQMGLISVAWSLRTFDTKYSKNQVLLKLSKTKPGDIILMHDHLENTCEIVEEFVNRTRNNGLKFVNLEDTLLKD